MSTPIDEKYNGLVRTGLHLGNPLGKERTCPDGVGHYRHFQGGSIYWTPETGAFEVHGAIREKWKSLGWEKSFLGYPVTDESDTPGGHGRYNNFQGGTIWWTAENGAWVTEGSDGGNEATGSISGKGYGPEFERWKSVLDISLYGPEERSTHFDAAGEYSFTGLPQGEYRVSLDSKKWDAAVKITPMTHRIPCSGTQVRNVNFKIG